MNREGASFCSSCGESLELNCPVCSTPYTAGASFCSNCGARLAGDSGESEPALNRYLPAELQAKLEAARAGKTMAGERRTITMLFADLQGSTAAAERLDPEEWAEVVNGAFERLIKPVYRYEGTLARLMGDAVLAFFGAPIAHEDDPERAVMAGLEMLSTAKPYAHEVRARWDVDFNIRVGINTGLVVVGEVGSDLRVEYSALGDAVNVAARMEQTAAPGTLQVTETTHRLISQLFTFEELEPVEAKGKAEPIPTYRVTGVVPRPSAVRGILGRDTRIVGRERELDTLSDVIESVRLGKGQVCTVIGEAGVGKSKLAAALKADLAADDCLAPWLSDRGADRQVRWAEARCLSFNSSVPYAPFIDLFTGLFDLQPDEGPLERRSKVQAAVASVLPDDPMAALLFEAMLSIDQTVDVSVEDQPPVGEDRLADMPPPLLQKRIFGSVVDYIEACSVSTPSILVIEDLHWADAVSLALLEELMRATDRSMLAIIALMRPYRDDAAWGFHETAGRNFSHRYTSVSLEPLDPTSARTLVADLLGSSELPEELLTVINERAEGNPFFVEEILRELMESESLTRISTRWTLAKDAPAISIPGGITGLLTARLDRLDESARLVLQLASVLGREFEFDELRELAGGDATVDTTLSELMHRDLLSEQSRIPKRRYAFRHALIQEAAYDTILLKTRRTLHAQIAERLVEESGEPHEIARHLVESRQELRAVPYLAEAGDRASRAMSLADAIRFYDQALTWAADGGDFEIIKRIYEGLGAAYTLIPDLSQASASYQRMLEFGQARSEPSVQIVALNRLGFTAAALGGDYERATKHLEEARRLAEEFGDGAGLAEYHINSCMIATTRGDMETAAAHDAETVKVGNAVGSSELILGGLLQRALSLIHAAQFEEAFRAFEVAKEATAGITSPHVTSMLAASEFFFRMRDGDLAGAWELTRKSVQETARSSTASSVALLAGSAATLLGDYENALALYAQAVRVGEETDQMFNSAAGAAAMSRIYAELGIDDVETSDLRAKALAYLEVPMGETLASTVFAELGWAAVRRGHVTEAGELFARGIAGSSATKLLELPSLLLGLATVQILDGAPDTAEALIDEAFAFIDTHGLVYFRPLESETRGARLVAAQLLAEAAEVLTAGAEDALSMGMATSEWRIQVARAEVLDAMGDPDAAAGARAAARQRIDDQANRMADAAMRASLLEVARRFEETRVLPSGGPPAGPDTRRPT